MGLQIKNLRSVEKHILDIQQKAIKMSLEDFKTEVIEDVKDKIKQSGLVKSGKMFRSVDAFLRGLTLEVFVGTSYAKFVERRKHFLREEFLTQKTTAVTRLTELVKKHLRTL